jgi:hypothetical protein
MCVRSMSFGAAAAAYERFRPGYPAELFDTVMRYARQPIRTALEIGAGTGKATAVLSLGATRPCRQLPGVTPTCPGAFLMTGAFKSRH